MRYASAASLGITCIHSYKIAKIALAQKCTEKFHLAQRRGTT